MIKVTVWNENAHEKILPLVTEIYPGGIHEEVARILKECDDVEVRTATLDMPECGLPDEVLNDTDVLIWWGHMKHPDVPDELVAKIKRRVHLGMGFIALHSAHHSKIFKSLMGTECYLRWKENQFERIWNINPAHPIAEGIPSCFVLPEEEMYGEFFDIPAPESIVFLGWYKGGEVFRSGCCWTRGAGKIFYWQPGHETNKAFLNPYCRKVIQNAVHWAAPTFWRKDIRVPYTGKNAEENYALGIEEEI